MAAPTKTRTSKKTRKKSDEEVMQPASETEHGRSGAPAYGQDDEDTNNQSASETRTLQHDESDADRIARRVNSKDTGEDDFADEDDSDDDSDSADYHKDADTYDDEDQAEGEDDDEEKR